MHVGDTIIARSSPPGRSARALIRLSGPDAHEALARLAPTDPLPPSPSSPSKSAPPRCAIAHLRLGPATLPALLTRSSAPRTATGEDTAELLLPGNPALVDRVIHTLIAASAGRVRLAEPGEFSARAFLNGRLDLVQAEGVARLISARSEGERHAARRLITGAQTAIYTDLSARVAHLLALVEAGIDFTDQEDVVAISPRELADGLDAILGLIDQAIGHATPKEAVRHRPRVVLVGPPSAGKSSLFNALLGRPRAVVSASPGSTRDVLVEPLDLSHDVPGGPTVELCDLAGLDESPTASPSARAAQDAALAAIAAADVLVLCDPHARFEALEAWLPPAPHEQRVLRLRTKGDLPLPQSDKGSGGAVYAPSSLTVCALDGWHLPALRRAIADAAGSLEPASDVLPRHRAAVAQAGDVLGRTLATLDPSAHHLGGPELLAAGLRDALDALGQITGRTTPDDILGRIFSSFCVGK